MDCKKLLSEMTLEEKAGMCSGQDFWHTKAVERLGVPQVMMCDGPHGLRKQKGEGDHLGINESIKAVCFPTASALASSFDTELLYTLGQTLGEECQAEDISMLLGPGLNMKRSPLCGRNFEYFSEDPFLAGSLGAAYIRGLQSKGVASCMKHFAGNNQETRRMNGTSNIDERTLHEIYLPAFEMAVKEGKVHSVMCAYNAVNGTYCAENRELLTKILREEWGFDGFVVTDWGAVKDRVKGLLAGLDLEMPGSRGINDEKIVQAVRGGQLDEAVLDKTVLHILQLIDRYQSEKKQGIVFDRTRDHWTSEKMAEECAVLIKNDGILPLSKDTKVAFVGEFAKTPRYQGGGSSFINSEYHTSAMDAAGENVTYVQGYHLGSGVVDDVLIREAVEAAKSVQVAVIFAGLPDSYESEGYDRRSLAMPVSHNALIHAVAAVQPNTVVVLHGGAPMEMPWLSEVKAVLCMYLGGDAVGKATVELLYGAANPCGKLAETWPLKLSDNPSYLSFPGEDGVAEYREGIYIGYRYYDKKEMDVLLPFGYGLSYTRFAYSDLALDKSEMDDTETLTVRCKVKNIGSMAGKEVVQLYVRDLESSVGRPVRELRGFAKVSLGPGEEKEVAFKLGKRAFAYYEPKIHDFYVESGAFTVEVAASSRDIRLSAQVQVNGTLRLPVVFTVATPIGAVMSHPNGMRLFEQLQQSLGALTSEEPQSNGVTMLGDTDNKMMQSAITDMPIGALVTFGRITPDQLEGVLTMLNQ